jgi:Tol biopolymer transport system component/DNA-binding SARP family transcriptional activator
MTLTGVHSLRVLGGVELDGPDGEPVRPVLAQPRRLALLIYLATANGGFHRRDTPIGIFWPEVEESRARQALNRAIYFLRQYLPPEGLQTRGDHEVGVSPEHLTCDAARFGRALAAGDLERALALYQGDLAPGFLLDDAPEFVRWLEGERARLRGQAVRAAVELARREEAAGRDRAAERWLGRAAELAPLDEQVASRRMLLLDRQGDRAGAVRVFEALRERLHEDLEVEPSPETMALDSAIRSRQALRPTGGIAPPAVATEAPGAARTESTGTPAVAGLPTAVRWPWRPAAVIVTLVLAGGWAALMIRPHSPTLSTGHAVPLTSDPGIEFQPALSPDGSLVAFVAMRGGRHSIVVRSAAGAQGGSELLPAASQAGEQYLPTWSPDGQVVRFVDSPYDGRPGPPPNWYEVPARGGPPRRVELPRPTRWVAWTRDASRAAFAERDSLFIYDLHDRSITLLAVQGAVLGIHSLTWSPDEKWLAYVAGNSFWPWTWNTAPSSIWLADTRNGSRIQVTDGTHMNVSPAWADSRHLLFISDRDGRREVYAVALGRHGPDREPAKVAGGTDSHSISLSADGRRLALAHYTTDQNVWSFADSASPPGSLAAGRRVTGGAQVVETHDVSPDGKWLVYDSNLFEDGDLFKVPVAGGTPVPVVSGMTAASYPRYSPDGREIAFSGGRDWDVWVVAADGGAPTRVTSEPGIGEVPIWSPDGLRLAYRRPRAGGIEGWTVSRPRIGASWEAPRRLTTVGCAYQFWAPDGSGLLCGRPGSDTLTLVSTTGAVAWRRDLSADGLRSPGPGAFSENGKTLYLRAEGISGPGIWAWPYPGGRPRLVVPLGNPELPAVVYPGNVNVSSGRLFLTVSRLESDIWVMDLTR